MIRDVLDGGAAQAAGLRIGEVITEVGGADIAGASDLTEALGAHEPGEEVEIVIEAANCPG